MDEHPKTRSDVEHLQRAVDRLRREILGNGDPGMKSEMARIIIGFRVAFAVSTVVGALICADLFSRAFGDDEPKETAEKIEKVAREQRAMSAALAATLEEISRRLPTR